MILLLADTPGTCLCCDLPLLIPVLNAPYSTLCALIFAEFIFCSLHFFKFVDVGHCTMCMYAYVWLNCVCMPKFLWMATNP